jgi:EKC/KEOPS complex subunit PCC1/LAGE3
VSPRPAAVTKRSTDPDGGLPRSTVRIPFLSASHASIAKRAIEVDAELQPQAVRRTIYVEGDELVAYVFPPIKSLDLIMEDRTFETLTVRLARLTVNAFLENVDLVVRTLGEFSEEAERRGDLD